MTADRAVSRADFALALTGEAQLGKKTLLLGPLGAGKSHTLIEVREALRARSTPCVFIDLFTAASTPEHLLTIIGESVRPFMTAHASLVEGLVAEGASDRHRSSSALLRLFALLEKHPPDPPFVWLIDEVTEIRSLAYFPELGRVEEPLGAVLRAAHGAILTSSYLGLAPTLFPEFEVLSLQGLTSLDLEAVPSLRTDGSAVASAIRVTNGAASTLLPLVLDMRDTRDMERSLVRLLRPGGALELACRRHYEVLLMRSRGYAVCKRAAEVVAGARGQRLTDLFPSIGRTPGASRQYLGWLVEVGLLTQMKKRYDFADPVVGLWASLYLGRGDAPSKAEIEDAVTLEVERHSIPAEGFGPGPTRAQPIRRTDRFEEID